MNEFKHQGDVTIHPYKGSVKGKELTHNGSYTLAYGEKTGHHHTIAVENPKAMTVQELPNGYVLLTLTEPGTITHQEHLQITVAPGTYRVGHEREKDWFSLTTRQVID